MQVAGIMSEYSCQTETERKEKTMADFIQTIASVGILASICTLTVMAVINSFK